MSVKRTVRLNSLLKEVISEVIRNDIHHMPLLNHFVSITSVDITGDLSYAKVLISVIGSEQEKKDALEQLKVLAGPIAKMCSKKVVMRFFPKLEFAIDVGLEKQLRMEDIFAKLADEREQRS